MHKHTHHTLTYRHKRGSITTTATKSIHS